MRSIVSDAQRSWRPRAARPAARPHGLRNEITHRRIDELFRAEEGSLDNLQLVPLWRGWIGIMGFILIPVCDGGYVVL